MKNLELPEWQRLYRDALIEADPNTFSLKLRCAKEAMYGRLQAMRPLDDPKYQAERHAINEALDRLNALRE